MRKILQFMFAALLVQTASAQSIYKQTFDDGTLGDMTIVDNDGLTPAPNVSQWADAWTVSADGLAISNSWYSPAGQADDWMITPMMSIVEEGTQIIWQARAIDPQYADGYQVLVSTTDAELASFTDVIFETSGETANGELVDRAASLNDYVGQDIYIAFRNNSFDKFLLAVDNIEVVKFQPRDVITQQINTYKFAEVGTAVAIEATIENNGSDVLESVDLNWSDGTNTYTETITGLNLALKETATITATDMFMVTESAQTNISVWTSNPNGDTDLDETNDMATSYVAGVENTPDVKMVVEEGTGAWCGWCPRGWVGLANMLNDHPDDFIGIAVHNGDPMAIAQYDGPLGISAFPGSKINRFPADQDPSYENLQDLYPQVKSLVVPIEVSGDAIFDGATRELTINANTTFYSTFSSADFRIAAVVLESGVTNTSDTYAHANFYSGNTNATLIDPLTNINYFNLPNPIPAADMVYDHVARDILPSFDGAESSIPVDGINGETYTFSTVYTVPQNFDINQMSVALLAIDAETGLILNAYETHAQLMTDVTEVVNQNLANVYPNPASDFTMIDINLEEAKNVTLSVTDIMGRTISTQNLGTIKNQQVKYDVSALENGMYTFTISAENEVAVKRISVLK